jgi:ribonuclease III
MARAKHERVTTDVADTITRAEQIIGHHFEDPALLMRALTHPSVLSETPKDTDQVYERMEFLGDSILGFLIANEAYRRFPDMREGGMTRIRGRLIAGSVQSKVARDLGIGDLLVFGETERQSGGRGIRSALENAYEAITAAIYLDAGLEAAREWMLRTMGPLITEEAAAAPENPKSLLQELVQARGGVPAYETISQQGPAHDRTFTVQVQVNGDVLGKGTGRTKREAEAQAAAVALKTLQKPVRKARKKP